MNEITLNAIINLFALFSAITESNKAEVTRNFSLYLRQHFGISDDSDYLRLFEELLDIYGLDGEPTIPIDLIEQTHIVSTNIKSLLQKDEQVRVFMRFLELIKGGNQKKAEVLIDTLAEVFEINKEEVEKITNFIFYPSKNKINSPDFLLVNSNKDHEKHKYQHIYEKNMDGELLFLRCYLVGYYVFIFHGSDYLTIEGNPIIPGRFYAFMEGSIIRGPRISPIYFSDISTGFANESLSTGFVFSGDEIEFKFKNSNNGLHQFSFSENSGQLIAVMGGSGVGKSTLLNILNGNIPVQHGSIKINQTDIYEKQKETRRLIGYVPQDDLLFEDLTVWENLFFNATLCFDQLAPQAIHDKVTKVLHELELHPFKDLKVGDPLNKVISGGQRKRLNVALELIREPAILFVDEPTSGLSSTDSEKVILLLKQQARKGKLIIINIHQPSSAIFKMFDKLWIMDSGGRPIYTGNPLDAIIYFKTEVNHVNAEVCECVACGNVNPEQVLEIVETKKMDESGNFLPERHFTPEFWYTQYRKRSLKKKEKIQNAQTGLPIAESKNPGLAKQFKIFFERNLRIKLADRQYLIINLLEAPILALIVAYFTRFSENDKYVFFENKSLISYLFMAIVVVLFMGMSVSAEEIIKDRKILKRESFLNLSRFSYLNSKIVFLVLLSAFQTFSFVFIGNLILGIHHMTMAYWLILFAVAVFSNLLGLNISSAFDSVVAIYVLIPLLLIPQILLCGVIVKFDDLQSKNAVNDVVPITGEVMASRWAFEALAVEQFKDNRYMAQFFDLEKEMTQARYRYEILTTQLIGQVDLVDGWIRLHKPESAISEKLTIIKNEIEKLDNEKNIPAFEHLAKLTFEDLNHDEATLAKAHLEKLKEFHKKRYYDIKREKDALINHLTKESGSDYLYKQKLKYHNQALEALVLNSESNDFLEETPAGYIQKVAPIYKDATMKNGRAHFLASQKNILGHAVDTFYFNLSIIWLMSIFLYIALYYNWLRKLLQLPERIKQRKPGKNK